jgi:nucleotidyltransferase substrate binding protein (TIGR01987 family)
VETTLENYCKALQLLQSSMYIDVPSEVERAGMIHFFEITFELSWKLMKDYFEEEGIQEIAAPKQIIKKAFEIGLIENGHHWLDAIEGS